nr:C-terminal binding protein [Brevibacterium daeguense]
MLEEHGWDVRVLGTRDHQVIIEAAQDATALMVGYATVDAAMIDALPQVQILSLLSMGFDNVDLEHAARRGVWVTNVPGAATREVAEHTLALALNLGRRVHRFHAGVRRGEWRLNAAPTPMNLAGTTCSVIGFGRIGREFARLAAPVFREVLVFDPFVDALSPDDEARGIRLVGFEEALRGGEIVSLHMPLTPETDKLLAADQLALLPHGAQLINVSRGELLDEPALLRALDSGQLGGAALDVLTVEPPSQDSSLVHHENVIVTPHIGFLSERTALEYPLVQACNAIALLETGRPLNPVNEPHPPR